MQALIPQPQNRSIVPATFFAARLNQLQTSVSISPIPQRGITVEKLSVGAGQCLAPSAERHLISVSCGQAVRLEYRATSGRAVTCVQPAGTITIRPAGVSPTIRVQGPAEFIQCAIDDGFAREVTEQMQPRPTVKPTFNTGLKNARIESILQLLLEEFESPTLCGNVYVESLVYALTTRYLSLDVLPKASARSSVSALPARLLVRVREKIEANLQADLSLNCLAEETGYSREHFLRMFRSATGFTPHQYIVELRIKRAKDWLSRKGTSLIDIAALCGFSSQSHMTSVFRKRLGVTPAEFRRSPYTESSGA